MFISPEKFAAAIPIGGGGDVLKMKLMKDSPVWAFNSSVDKVVHIENVRDLINSIKSIGGDYVLEIC